MRGLARIAKIHDVDVSYMRVEGFDVFVIRTSKPGTLFVTPNEPPLIANTAILAVNSDGDIYITMVGTAADLLDTLGALKNGLSENFIKMDDALVKSIISLLSIPDVVVFDIDKYEFLMTALCMQLFC